MVKPLAIGFASLVALLMAMAPARAAEVRIRAGESGMRRMPATSLHPQDGPHADLRIEILPDRIVEHVAMNLVFLDEFAPTPREKSDDFHPVELPAVHDALATAMAVHARVTVDGIAVPPRIEALQLAAVDTSLLPLFPRSGMRGMRRVEFQAVYTLKQPPTRVTIRWDVYPEDLLSKPDNKRYIVLSGELEGEGRRLGIELSRDTPEIEWRAPSGAPGDELQAVPQPMRAAAGLPWFMWIAAAGVECAAIIAMLLLLAARTRAVRVLAALPLLAVLGLPVLVVQRIAPRVPLPSENEALQAFTPLHANLYRALDYVREGDVYDVLARSADGPLLEGLYRQMRRSVTIEEAGGAVGRVMAVRPIESRVETIVEAPGQNAPRAEFAVVTRWQVDGTVSHWGHRHDRTNEYRARYRVAATPAGWRIVGEELLDERRVDEPPATLPPDGDDIL